MRNYMDITLFLKFATFDLEHSPDLPFLGFFWETASSALGGETSSSYWQSKLQSQSGMEEEDEKKKGRFAVVPLTPWRLREMRRKEARDQDKSMIRRSKHLLLVLEGALVCWQQWYWQHMCDDGNEGAEEGRKGKKEEVERGQTAQVLSRPAARESASVIDYSKLNGLECSSDDQEEDIGDICDYFLDGEAHLGEENEDGEEGGEDEENEEMKK